jgi:hypothetical protein
VSASAEIILAVACAVGGALLGAYASYLFTKSIENKKAAQDAAIAAVEAQRKLAEVKAGRIRDVWIACRQLRIVTDQWYKEIRGAIDPSQHPSSIAAKIQDLFLQNTYEGQFSNLKPIIESEPACAALIGAYWIWTRDAFLSKSQGLMNDGVIYASLANDPQLNRLHAHGRSHGDPADREQYLMMVQQQLFRCYSKFDAELNKAIEHLYEMESEARQESQAGLAASA